MNATLARLQQPQSEDDTFEALTRLRMSARYVNLSKFREGLQLLGVKEVEVRFPGPTVDKLASLRLIQDDGRDMAIPPVGSWAGHVQTVLHNDLPMGARTVASLDVRTSFQGFVETLAHDLLTYDERGMARDFAHDRFPEGMGRLTIPARGEPEIGIAGPFVGKEDIYAAKQHVDWTVNLNNSLWDTFEKQEELLDEERARAARENLVTLREVLRQAGATHVEIGMRREDGANGMPAMTFFNGTQAMETPRIFPGTWVVYDVHEGPVHSLHRVLWDEGLETLAGIVADELLQAQRPEECHWAEFQGRATVGLDGRAEIAILSFTPMVPEDADAPAP